MKNFLKTLNFLILFMSLVNCSKSQFDKAGGYSNSIGGAKEVIYTDPQGSVVLSQDVNNIYIAIDRKCVKGLASNADDPIIEEKIRHLHELMNQAQSGEDAGNHSYDKATLEVRYDDNSRQTFDVDINQSGKGLSNSDEIRDFFDNLRNEIHRHGVVTCRNTGK